MTDPIRLAELTGAVARSADAGIGFPPETSLRLCLVAVALARAVGLSDEETRDVYHAALLRHAGCTASAHEETQIAGDEIELRSTIAMGDAGSPGDMLPRLLRGVARGQGLRKRVLTVTTLLARAPSALPVALRGRCEVAIRFAVRLGLGPRVERALDEAFERWDGKGLPAGRKGTVVSMAARIVSLAELAAAYVAVGGVHGAREVVAARSGGHVDPELAARFVADAETLLADAMAPSLWDRVLDVEPRPVARVGASQQRAVAELLADFADLKSTWTLGHSRGVAARVLRGAEVSARRTRSARVWRSRRSSTISAAWPSRTRSGISRVRSGAASWSRCERTRFTPTASSRRSGARSATSRASRRAPTSASMGRGITGGSGRRGSPSGRGS